MKKYFIITCAALLSALSLSLVSCGDDNDPEPPKTDPKIEALYSNLRGTFTTTFYLFYTDKVWYTETITFYPYSTPKKVFVFLEGREYEMYGTALIDDTRFTDITGKTTAYYTFSNSRSIPTITFFPCNEEGNVVNKADERNIILVNPTSFYMWPYGLTQNENQKLYEQLDFS